MTRFAINPFHATIFFSKPPWEGIKTPWEGIETPWEGIERDQYHEMS